MSRRRWAILGAALGGAALAGLVVLATLYASMSGGWDDAFRRKKTESSREVRAARERAGPVLDARVRDLVEGPVARALGPRAGAEVGPARSHCEEGQHNWKIDVDYDVRCELVAEVVAVGAQRHFRRQAAALGSALAAGGWHAPAQDVAEVLANYWDRNAGEVPRSPSGDGLYTPVDLPDAVYAAEGFRLEVAWTDPTDTRQHRAAAAGLREGEYALVLTVRHPYFQG